MKLTKSQSLFIQVGIERQKTWGALWEAQKTKYFSDNDVDGQAEYDYACYLLQKQRRRYKELMREALEAYEEECEDAWVRGYDQGNGV